MSPGHNLRRPTLSCPATLPFNISLRVKLNQLLGLNHRRAKASKGLAAPAQIIPRQILRVLCAICYQGDRLLRCKAPSPYHKPPPCPPPLPKQAGKVPVRMANKEDNGKTAPPGPWCFSRETGRSSTCKSSRTLPTPDPEPALKC